MKKIKFEKQEDMMPAEVATELLRTPGTRLSSRMRKECWAARSKVIESASPVHRALDGGYETDEKQIKRAFADKCKRRFAKLGMAKLIQIGRTTFKRRIAVQRPFVKYGAELAKMQEDNSVKNVIENAPRFHFITEMLRTLASDADRLDTIMDALSNELDARHKTS